MASNQWTINFLPEEGGRFTGKLKLTEEDLEFKALYDSSNSQVIKGIGLALGSFAVSGGHASYFHDTDSNFGLTLPRAEIAKAEVHKRFLMKRAVVTMQDGSNFVFDYGLLSPKKLVEAINT